MNIFYPWSAYNSRNIGKFVADGLKNFFNSNYPLEKFHLIGKSLLYKQIIFYIKMHNKIFISGHSLGAHIAGMIGRHFIEITGKKLPRITGLDPAKPCFINDAKLKGLSPGDAEFIDVIHSDSAIYGLKQRVGDADFYPNGYRAIPAGCETITCAHSRSWQYYAETVYPGNEYGFMAAICTSLKALNDGKCEGERYPMGIACPTSIRGDLFLHTRDTAPYGLNSLPLSQIQCSSLNLNKTGIIF